MLLARSEDPLEPAALERYQALVARRCGRVPLPHLTGRQAFWRQDLLVTPDVLVPRPETELLVECALETLRERKAPRVADVGTGGGAVALALATERPDARVVATDVSPAALLVARENAARLGLLDRVLLVRADLLSGVRAVGRGLDLVVSNPPYIGADELPLLEPEVREHEPRLALVPPGGDRYEVYERLAPQAAARLRPDGALLVEVGSDMAERVRSLCLEAGFADVVLRRDLAGRERVVAARRKGPRERDVS